jgi:hypothetical protein
LMLMLKLTCHVTEQVHSLCETCCAVAAS